MTTVIRDKSGKGIRSGHNLGIMFRMARHYGGVLAATIHTVKQDLPQGRRPDAFMVVEYANGFTAESYFQSYGVALCLARERSARKGTYWSGCAIHTPGAMHVAGSEHEGRPT